MDTQLGRWLDIWRMEPCSLQLELPYWWPLDHACLESQCSTLLWFDPEHFLTLMDLNVTRDNLRWSTALPSIPNWRFLRFLPVSFQLTKWANTSQYFSIYKPFHHLTSVLHLFSTRWYDHHTRVRQQVNCHTLLKFSWSLRNVKGLTQPFHPCQRSSQLATQS